MVLSTLSSLRGRFEDVARRDCVRAGEVPCDAVALVPWHVRPSGHFPSVRERSGGSRIERMLADKSLLGVVCLLLERKATLADSAAQTMCTQF